MRELAGGLSLRPRCVRTQVFKFLTGLDDSDRTVATLCSAQGPCCMPLVVIVRGDRCRTCESWREASPCAQGVSGRKSSSFSLVWMIRTARLQRCAVPRALVACRWSLLCAVTAAGHARAGGRPLLAPKVCPDASLQVSHWFG